MAVHDSVPDSIRAEAIGLSDQANGVWIRNFEPSLANMDSLQVAVDMMTRACRIDSTNYRMRVNKGKFLLDVKRYAEAVECFENAHRIASNVCEIATGYGVAVELTGDKVAAKKMYSEAINIFDRRYGADNKTERAVNRIVLLMLLEEPIDIDAAFRRIEGWGPLDKNSILFLMHQNLRTMSRQALMQSFL